MFLIPSVKYVKYNGGRTYTNRPINLKLVVSFYPDESRLGDDTYPVIRFKVLGEKDDLTWYFNDVAQCQLCLNKITKRGGMP